MGTLRALTIAVLPFAVGAIGCNDPRLLASGTDPTAPDAAAPAPDAPPAASGPVSLVVTQLGLPEAGMPVVFQAADSSVIAITATDSTGTASATMPAGGFVTMLSTTLGPELRTFAGVQPGDALTFDDPATAQLDVFSTPPVDPAASDSTYYYAYSTSGAPATLLDPGTQTSIEQKRTGLNDMVVVTTDTFQGMPVDFLYQPDVLIGNGATIDLFGSYEHATPTTLTYANIPTSALFETFTAIVTARGVLYQSPNLYTAPATAVPAPAGSTAVISTYVAQSSVVGAPYTLVADWGPPTGSRTLDYATTGLGGFIASPSIDAATHAIRWTDAPGPRPDYTFALYSDERATAPFAWAIVAPHGEAASVTYPQLPAIDGVDYNPAAGDTLGVTIVSTITVTGGYDAVRNIAFDASATTLFAATALAQRGGSGRAVVATYLHE